MLVLVWVLEVNSCSTQDIVHGLSLLLGLPHFKPRQADALRQALLGCAQGLHTESAPRG